MKRVMKHKLGIANMNKNLALFACVLGSLGLSGCVTDSPYNEGLYVSQQVNAPASASGSNIAPSPCDNNYLDAACQGQFVNYTNVAADYRQYGERSPRDVMVSQAAAGNNMTASIPPSIENEVVEYEENVGISEETYGNDANSQSGDDPVEDWMADEGQNLKTLLTEWSDRAGWRLVWDTNRNYTLTAGAMFRGNFADVSSALIRAFARARPAPVATFYKGNRVLVVETMEDENAY